MGGSSNGIGLPWGTTKRATANRQPTTNYEHQQQNPFVALPQYSQGSNSCCHENESLAMVLGRIPSGGSSGRSDKYRYGYGNDSDLEDARLPSLSLVRFLGTLTRLLVSMGKTVLPPLVGTCKGIVAFYGALPIDAIAVQIGLVYCFLGGYYPTLFSSLQAARYCGWNIAVNAISDLADEAIKVIDEIDEAFEWDNYQHDETYDTDSVNERQHRKHVFLQKTQIVLKTVDPVKINTAAGALYTTWLGISTILQREYARVISLSLTLAEGMEQLAGIVLVPALRLVIPTDYRRWVPVLVGWTAKAAAMKIAWRIERVLTAATTAIAGGALVARSLTRMIANHRAHKQRPTDHDQQQQQPRTPRWKRRRKRNTDRSLVVPSTETNEYDIDGYSDLSVGEQLVGFAVGGLGFYTQMETQYKKKFSFEVPFPYSVVTWPFDLAERWIQWHITPTSTATVIK